MSRIVICDVCGEPEGLAYRLSVAPPVSVHDGEVISDTEVIDICGHCLRLVPDLSTGKMLEEIVRTRRERTREEAEGGAA